MLMPICAFNVGIKLELVHSANNDGDDTSDTYTFSSVPIGSPSSDRLVIVCAYTNPTNNGFTQQSDIASIDIAGSPATEHVSQTAGNDAFYSNTVIASRVVATGTTADIVLNLGSSDNATGAAIIVYTLKNYVSATPTDTASAGDGGGPAISLSTSDLTIPAKGVAVIAAGVNTCPTGPTWGGAGVVAGAEALGDCDLFSATCETPGTPTITFDGTSNNVNRPGNLVAVAWN